MKEFSFVLTIVLLIFLPSGVISYIRPNDESLLLISLALNSLMFICGFYLHAYIKKLLDLNKESDFKTNPIAEAEMEDEE